MIGAWMLSAALFALLAGVAADAAERALRAVGRPGRTPWLIATGCAAIWPVVAPFARWLFGLVTPGATGTAVTARLPALRITASELPGTIGWGIHTDTALALAWLVGSGVMLVRLLLALRALQRVTGDAEERIIDGVPVLVTQMLGPAVIGARQPRIIVPRWLLDLDASLRAFVLRHEQEHCVARDHRAVLGSAVAMCLFPWNPAIWWIARRLRLALERDCDARVLNRGASVERYGKLLILIAQRQSAPRLLPLLAASNSHLERRILAMRTPLTARPRLRLCLFSAIAILAAAAAACSSPSADGPSSASAQPDRAGAPAPAPGTPYFEFQVQHPATALAENPAPQYPEALRAAGTEGEVMLQFVVNPDGTVDPNTETVLKSSAPEFTSAARSVVGFWRFSPATVKGHPVRQLVQVPFLFKLGTTRASGTATPVR